MIKIDKVSYSFPQKDLYNKISFTLDKNQHCAFIGTSGTGKSTLIDMIMDPEKYIFDGKIEIDPNCRIGYVSQFSKLDPGKDNTVFQYIGEEFIKLQNKIDAICTKMETSLNVDSLLEEYQQALDAQNAMGGEDFESKIIKKLNLANLKGYEERPVSKLSGGEFKLVQVMKEMLTVPDLMIMDEPDVYLDFEHLNALKNLINSHKGMLLVVTHNRYLLNHCFNKIIHLENTEIQEFDGRYIDYNFALLQSKIELQELAIADEEEIERNEKIIDKLRMEATFFTCASRGKTLNARVSLLERLEARKIKEPFVDIKQPKIHFSTEDSSLNENREETKDKVVLKVKDYQVSFQEVLLKDVNFEIKAQDKIALVGPNGTGKTTMLREIFQNNQAGIQVEEGVQMAFLSQLQGEMLKESNTIEEEFLEAGFQTYEKIQNHLLNYGFKEENMKQKIESLSGGEKNLLQLAKISAGNANFLLLDEPTSHLDTYSQIAQEKAMAEFKGAILMVSHDFYSIANCMDYILLIEDKTIRKMSVRKFRKMIYAKHFDKDYLEIEQKKKEIETKIDLALEKRNFVLAKTLSEELEKVISLF
ncbi:MAG: ABC-F family ATP-binding cassette domain-containing protein [Acetivibrio sp.]